MKANRPDHAITIGVFSASSPVSATAPVRYLRGKDYLTRKGLRVVDGALAFRRAAKELLCGRSLSTAMFFKRLFLKKPAFAPAYNAALLDYQAGRYPSAYLWARRADAQGCGEEKTEALILGLFALQAAGSPRFGQEVKKIQTVTDRWYTMDKFVLTFLSGDMETARAQIPSLLDTCYLNVPELAMVMSCLLAQGSTRAADEALHGQLALLHESPYRQYVREEARKMIRARVSKRYREKLIGTYRYGHPLI